MDTRTTEQKIAQSEQKTSRSEPIGSPEGEQTAADSDARQSAAGSEARQRRGEQEVEGRRAERARGGETRSGHSGSRTGRTVDGPEKRPGVPMTATPPRPAEGAHWPTPSQQPGLETHLHRAALERPTPVAGTAQPPHGVSGLIRRRAYDMPEHRPLHWALLFVADRVDVLEHRIAPVLATPLEKVGFTRGSRMARSNPIGLLAGVVVGAWLTKRVLF